jgi:hypothetical protein
MLVCADLLSPRRGSHPVCCEAVEPRVLPPSTDEWREGVAKDLAR